MKLADLFGSGKQLGQALRAWRILILGKPIKSITHQQSREPKYKACVALETKGSIPKKINLITGILPMYDIKDVSDLDLFLDFVMAGRKLMAAYAVPEDLESEASENLELFCDVAREDTFNFLPFDSSTEVPCGPKVTKRVFPAFGIECHRTRLTVIKIQPGGETGWHHHHGHEFVYVNRGNVLFEFSETENGSRKRKPILRGGAVCLSAHAFHNFLVADTERSAAEIIVSRPTKSNREESI